MQEPIIYIKLLYTYNIKIIYYIILYAYIYILKTIIFKKIGK